MVSVAACSSHEYTSSPNQCTRQVLQYNGGTTDSADCIEGSMEEDSNSMITMLVEQCSFSTSEGSGDTDVYTLPVPCG